MSCIDFILIGAMKSGSTTLIEYLRLHPRIYVPTIKEPQYFSRDNKYNLGIEWYESLFTDAKENQICGEGSTCYSRWPKYPHAAKRIYSYAPDVKLIYLVRNPVDRAYSHFRHGYLHNEWSYNSFSDALRFEPEIVDSSKYMMQVDQYLQYFPKKNMHFILFDDLVSNNLNIFKRLFDFLEIDNFNVVNSLPVNTNAAAVSGVKRDVTKFLKKIRRVSVLKKLIDLGLTEAQRKTITNLATRSILRSNIGQKMIDNRKEAVPNILEDDVRYIKSNCSEDVKKFETFSNLDISNWY